MKQMRLFIFLFVVIFLNNSLAKGLAGGKIRVKGYTKKNGTYVTPHVKTTPNKTKTDNWSTKGNVNPVTGKKGTKNP